MGGEVRFGSIDRHISAHDMRVWPNGDIVGNSQYIGYLRELKQS